jgi:hypothetical protein
MHDEPMRPRSIIAALFRAVLAASVGLGVAGCEVGRTALPSPYAQSDAWAAARDACARDGRVPVARYERALVTQELAFHCEPPGQMLGGATAGN